MASQYCMGCGAPLAAGASRCAYCGRPVPAGAAGAPLPTTSAPPLAQPPPVPPPPPVAAARPRRRWGRIILIVVVVVIAVIAVLAVYGYYTTVSVSEINIYAPDDVCGLNVYQIAYTGFNASTGASVPISLAVPNNNSTACTLHGVTTNTSGFGVEDVQLPGPIPGNTTGGPFNGTLNLTLTLPGARYSGVVNLVFR